MHDAPLERQLDAQDGVATPLNETVTGKSHHREREKWHHHVSLMQAKRQQTHVRLEKPPNPTSVARGCRRQAAAE